MNYAIEILEKEAYLLKKCLTEWQSLNHPEAKKDRDNKLSDILKAIEKLKK